METTEFKEISKDQISQAKELVTTLIKLLGVELEIAEKVSKGRIVLNVKASEPGRLIGRRGSALEHLVLIVNKFLKSQNIEFPKVIINVEGFEKREKPVRQKRERNDNNRRQNNKRNDRRPREDKKETKTEAPVAKEEKTKTEKPKLESAPAKEVSEIPVPKVDAPAPKVEKAETAKPEKTEAAPKAKQENKKPVSKLQKQCRNASKEVKRWGEPVLLPAMPEAECFKAIDLLKGDKELVAVIDEKNYGDKKRVRVTLVE